MTNRSCRYAIFLLLLLSTHWVEAITAPARPIIPSTLEPSRVGQELAPPLETQKVPVLTPSAPFLIPGVAKFPPEMAKIKFTLKDIIIKNPVVFSCEELLEPFNQYLCQTVTLAEIQEIANQMTTRYQQEGYVLTQVIIPEQDIKNGVVVLQVVSGHIGNIKITGCYTPLQYELLMDYAAFIKCCKPMQQKVLERYTLLANDTPGMFVDAVLKPSTEPYAADLIFVIKPKPEPSFFAVNNWGTRFLGPRQYVFGTGVDSLYTAGDETTFQAVTTADQELNFVQLRHTTPICEDGFRLGGLLRFVRTEPGSILTPFDSKGVYKTVGIDFFYPIIRSRKEDLFVQGGYGIIDSKSDLLGAPLYADRIRPVFVSLAYNRQDTLLNTVAANHAEIMATQGIKMLDASGASNISRPGGKSQFTKFNGTVTRQQQLPKQFSLFLLATGQYSFQHLLAVSQFGFGGPDLGRGYDPSEILGDQGIAGSVELRYDSTYNIVPQFKWAQYYWFYDIGKIWHSDPTIRHASAASTGVGVRLQICEKIRSNLFVAKPLTRKVFALNNKHPRFFFNVTFLLD